MPCGGYASVMRWLFDGYAEIMHSRPGGWSITPTNQSGLHGAQLRPQL